MIDYKNTLNLPTTSFPMKASLAQQEPQRLNHWRDEDVYAAIRNARKGMPRFILHDGPPYANGHLHCGHALNKILKDIIIKSKTLSGYDAPFVPGWDCHGLPIELNVEKKHGKVGEKLNAATFRGLCRDYAASQIEVQKQEFIRLGVFGDWQNPYTTMSYAYEANIVRALGRIIQNGHLQQGFKPVHWCLDCRSALAEAEVDYEDKTSPSIDVAFYAQDPASMLAKIDPNLPLKPLFLPIWTTTPWTLPANEAVCLHPEIEYALFDLGREYALIAGDLSQHVLTRYQKTEHTPKALIAGAVLVGEGLRHPFYDKVVPVVLGLHVTTEAGTGCVHTAPSHGPDDYLVGLHYQLPITHPVMANGCYAEDVALFAGLSVLKANQPIIDLLREKNTLLHEENMVHSYPHCWRHKSPMIFRATPQWFIAMDKNNLRRDLLACVDNVQWMPEWGKARMEKMISDRPDWCISRQRAWSTPMPLFVHKASNDLHPKTFEFIEAIAKRIEQQGIEAWFSLDAAEFLGEDVHEYEKVKDTLDVWFDSGVSHDAVLAHGHALGFPADVYFEGSDQYRGWFNSSLTTSMALSGVPPYKKVLTHGYVVDSEGRKLSKSKGNYVDLEKMVHQHGADVLRLWVASTDYRNEVSISDEILKRNADAYRRIRNTSRFLLANLFDFLPEQHSVDVANMVEIDRLIVLKCQQLQQDIINAYEEYQFHLIYQKIHHFCSMDLGSFYLDIIKDRQYTTAKDGLARRSCQTAMYHVIHALTRWLAPLISFTAEEIWQHIPGVGDELLFVQRWYAEFPILPEMDMMAWSILHNVRDEVNKALEAKREAKVIGSGLEARVVIDADEMHYPILMRLHDELRFFLIVSSVEVRLKKDAGIVIEIASSTAEKCARCWHRREDVGQNLEHPTLCQRCCGNITHHPEQRCFV